MRDTSLEAFKSLENLNDKQRKVFDVIAEFQPCTDYEIAERLKQPINRITPRRGELITAGLIVEDKKVKGPTGRPSWTWKVASNQLTLF